MTEENTLKAMSGLACWSSFLDLLVLVVNYALINGDHDVIKSIDKVVHDYVSGLSNEDKERFNEAWEEAMDEKAQSLAEILKKE